ncbi:TonB-dependent receptor plug domain-containing protein, partial [bacterium]|nr:TonB-dependent receptor plug domain-containing protein [bacterium]
MSLNALAEEIPESPYEELTPEELERERLLPIAAEEAYLDNDLDQLLITGATRDIASTPYAVEVITGARLRELSYATLADALAFELGCYPDQRYRLGQNAGLSLRLSPTQHTTIRIDGIPSHHGTTWQETLALIPLNLVRRVEILRSPGGGLYSNSLGGVINVVTRNPNRLTLALAELAGGGGSFENQLYWGRFENRSAFVTYKVGGLKWSGAGAEAGFDRDGGSLDAEVRFDLSGIRPGEPYNGAEFGLYLRSWYGRNEDRLSLNPNNYHDNLNRTTYGLFGQLPFQQWGLLHGEFNLIDDKRSRRVIDSDNNDENEDEVESEIFPGSYHSRTINGLLRLNATPWSDGRFGLLLDGFQEYSLDFTESEYWNLGGGVSFEQGFFGGLTQLHSALRYDQHSYFGGFITGRGGLLQGLPHRHGTDAIFVNFSSGYRLPSLEERSFSNKELVPETGWLAEAGLRFTRFAPLKLEFTAFQRQVENAILPGETVVNQPSSQISRGLEAELLFGLDPFSAGSQSTRPAEDASWTLPLNIRLSLSTVWEDDDPAPYHLARGTIGYQQRFFSGDLTARLESTTSWLSRLPNLGYPGLPTDAAADYTNTAPLTHDFSLKLRL